MKGFKILRVWNATKSKNPAAQTNPLKDGRLGSNRAKCGGEIYAGAFVVDFFEPSKLRR